MFFHPLLPPVLGLLAGCLAGGALPPDWRPLWLGVGLTLAGLALAWLALRHLALFAARSPGSPSLSLHQLLGLAGASLVLGLGLAAWDAAPPPPDHLVHEADGQDHMLVADVLTAPEPLVRNSRLDLAAVSLDGRPTRGRLHLSLAPQWAPPPPGARVRLKVQPQPITSLANPGGYDYAAEQARQGFLVRAYAGAQAGLTVLGRGEAPAWQVWREEGRARLGLLLERLPPGPSRGLLRALILGQRGQLPPTLKEAFADLGAAHLLAISGLHLGLVWGAAFLLCRLGLAAWPRLALALPAPKLAALLALIPAAAYAGLAGASLPTLRALVMAGALAAALLLNRPYHAVGGLTLAALVILLLWPQSPASLSFQLSFTAVAAILLVVGPASYRLARRGNTPVGRWAARLGGWAWFSAGIGVAMLPLGVLYFHTLPFLFLPANLVLVPLTALGILPLGLAGAALGLFWPAGGLLVWRAALAPAGWAVEAAQALAAVPGATWFLAGPGPWAVGLVYAAAGVFFLARGAWRQPVALLLALAAVGAGLWPAAPAPGAAPPPGLTAWVLDVDQGSAAVVRLPQGQVVVVDGGGWPNSGFDMGRRVVAPFLWSQGIRRVHAVVASHSHPDHTDGLPFILEHFAPDELWSNGEPGEPADQGSYGRLLTLAASRGISLLTPGHGLSPAFSLGGAEVRVLWPPPPPAPRPDNPNQQSLWLGFGQDGAWLWLPGDNGPAQERALAPLLPRGGSQILAAPHHGGVDSCTPELLDRLAPQAVLFSCGAFNRFGMPRPAALAALAARGIPWYSTARHGCLTLAATAGVWRITPWLALPRPTR
ncbi:MAG: DNA internalization-related competence protein ComEC/Rec2 [Deltaproteobacteria bacterium]|nr:DNA internalization-related competence protein ComEC/Rec2 [Deltaproteobacteria bacterium]